MRRKLFLIFFIYLIICYIATSINYNSLLNSVENCSDPKHKEYYGKILDIKEYENNYKLKIRLLAENTKVLITCYKSKNVIVNDKICPDLNQLFLKNVVFNTKFEEPTSARNPNCFDYKLYLKTKTVSKIGKCQIFKTVAVKKSLISSIIDSYRTRLYTLKIKFLNRIAIEERGLIAGIIFGDTSMLDREIYEDFKGKGTAHLLAVSGLHINIIFNLYMKMIKRRSKITDIILVLLLLNYAELASWSCSIVRAVMMVIFKVTAYNFDERYDSLTALGLVGIILLTINPYSVFQVGFQLSFLATASIIFFRAPITKISKGKLPNSLIISLAVNIGIVPYVIFKFNYLPLAGFFINIMMIYVSAYLVPVIICSFIGFCLMGELGISWVLIYLAQNAGRVILSFNNLFYFKSGYGIYVASPTKTLVILVTLIVFFLASEFFLVLYLRKNKKIVALSLALFIILSLFTGKLNQKNFRDDEFVFIDVGQGDGLHIRIAGENVLIDGGGKMDYNVGEKVLKEYFLKNGVGHLDYAIASHLHTDHYLGMCQLSQVFRVDNLVVFAKNKVKDAELRREFKCKNIIYLSKGDYIRFNNGDYIKAVGPVDDGKGLNEEDENMNSLVLKVVVKGVSTLMTGDINSEGEKSVVFNNSKEDLNVDILKISHHGSRFSSDESFIKALSPKFAVIQVGKNNYGHPNPQVLEKLDKAKITVFRNDLMGAIGFDLADGNIKAVHCMID